MVGGVSGRSHTQHASEPARTTPPASKSNSSSSAGVVKASELPPASREAAQRFKSDPKAFMQENLVDIRKTGGDASPGGQLTALMLDSAKEGDFAFVPKDGKSNAFDLRHASVATTEDQQATMRAHWVPFHNGNVSPGFADIPKRPGPEESKFVFTPGMNGCALDVRQTKDSEEGSMLRVFHDQHPGATVQARAIESQSGDPVGKLTQEQYFRHDDSQPTYPIAFNAMNFSEQDENWHFLSQMQEQDITGDQELHRADLDVLDIPLEGS
ncbi:MAG: hypothetical protein KTR16_10210 [Acidiferrobacterales bacterium]|nr:hypothetical protein [Acidiferrobacterales bacterium]